jgi:hypothetical protein
MPPHVAEQWPSAIGPFEENGFEAARDFGGDLPQGALLARASGTLDQKIVTVIVVKLLQCLHDEKIDREPDRSTPVRVATEQPRAGLGRLVTHFVHAVVDLESIRMLEVITADRTDTVVAQKLPWVERPFEQALHPMPSHQRQKPPLAHPSLLPA